MNATESISIKAEANISDCGKYRYWLSRIWDESKPIGCFICINPSKATAIYSDQTMGNCNNLAAAWGWGGFYIVNLFAFMATDQSDLKKQRDKVGPLNNKAIKYICEKSDVLVLAWGNEYKSRAREVLSLLVDKNLFCIQRNKGGGFLHPNRIKYENFPQPVSVDIG
ncbi:DUF1643 domain-containing protein [Thalassotalea mangrovi]|uniref:DUF1643 domain-containing protein n=1 Tax=Thalassotalea mangrovi TaxID=2572245 RepID=A0A4V5NUB3_9GAMM|nr:DUF1643 domain-containing protein [Thalassotalea mangrovi]TKB45689.1 DUF1643 domain-containing protein [Thalassotalea mangrovi]